VVEEHNKDEDIEPTGSDLRNIGVSAGDLDTDFDTADSLENPPEEGMEGPEVAGPVVDGQAGGIPGGTPAPSANGM
jgi:hypothetical protein